MQIEESILNNTIDQSNAVSNSLNILHLSDLHVGVNSQSWLWPNFEAEFLLDIKRVHAKSGEINVIVFSGDLAQQATKQEYLKLDEILKKIYRTLNELGSNPILFTVPGNHDLCRPDSMNSTVRAFKDWEIDEELRNAFWNNKPAEYRDCINSAFSNYSHWSESLEENGFPTGDVKNGILPGDKSLRVQVGDKYFGLIGLNSSWLQLGSGDYKQRLDVDVRQLNAITDEDPNGWTSNNISNIIITHHPLDWLSERSQNEWRAEIYNQSKFSAHMFGHMHETTTIQNSEGGFSARRYLQSASLFGLEKTESGSKRAHGYSVLNISEVDSKIYLKQWPRIAISGQDGGMKLVPNFQMNIDHESGAMSFDTFHTNSNESTVVVKLNEKIQSNISHEVLDSIKKNLPNSEAHENVRKTEQAISAATLEKRTPLWLAADWGQGADEFINSVLLRIGLKEAPIYQIDLHACFNATDIYEAVQAQIGISFTNLCDLLSEQKKCLLILNDVPLNEGKDKEEKKLQADIEKIASVILEYCQDLRIVIKSLISPHATDYVRLQALDLADTSAYITANTIWSRQGHDTSFISKIHRHTDGLPSRIDTALKNIQYVGTNDLLSFDTDLSGKDSLTQLAPVGLINAIEELRCSPDPNVKKAFNLLTALAQFPRGELLSTVKRFISSEPFFPQHAVMLVESAFIDSVELPNVGGVFSAEVGSALVVKRPVRDYLTTILSDDELKKLNKKAFTIYFGDNWSLNGISSKNGPNFEDRDLDVWKLGNASVLIIRYLSDSLSSNNKSESKKAIDLATSFCAALLQGDRWSNVVSLCSDLYPIFNNHDVTIDKNWMLSGFYAKSLRMIGESEKAKNIYLKVVDSNLPISSASKQEHLLNLALCYENLHEDADAVIAAKKCIAIDSKTGAGLQAKSLVINLSENKDEAAKERSLLQIELTAKKQKHTVLFGTLAIERARRSTDSDEKRRILQSVVDDAKQNNDYNVLRAMLTVAQMSTSEGIKLEVSEVNKLVGAYHYLYSETLPVLFDQCTEVLWREFIRTDQFDNLFSLFRHSSLVWRLRDNKEKEFDYFRRLSKYLLQNKKELTFNSGREIAYFIARGKDIINIDDDSLDDLIIEQ